MCRTFSEKKIKTIEHALNSTYPMKLSVIKKMQTAQNSHSFLKWKDKGSTLSEKLLVAVMVKHLEILAMNAGPWKQRGIQTVRMNATNLA